MRNSLIGIITLASILLFTACGGGGGGGGGGGNPPGSSLSVDFTANVDDTTRTATFTPSVTGGAATSYLWDFGDGSGSTQASPSHTYAATGQYNVTLIVSGANSATGTKTKSVTISPPPISVDFNASVNNSTKSVAFTAQTISGSPTSWSWDFGDGQTGSTQASPSHTYAATGTYTVTLTATGSGGTVTKTKQITISANTALSVDFTFTVDDATKTVQFNTTVTDGSNPSFVWNFGDGQTGSIQASPSHTYAAAGTYTVKVTVTSGGDTATKTKSVTVNTIAVPPTANFNFSASGLTANFTDTSTAGTSPVASRAWTFGDGQSGTGASTSHTYTAAGTYSVKLTVTDSAGTSASITKQVTVQSGQQGSTFTATPDKTSVKVSSMIMDSAGTKSSTVVTFTTTPAITADSITLPASSTFSGTAQGNTLFISTKPNSVAENNVTVTLKKSGYADATATISITPTAGEADSPYPISTAAEFSAIRHNLYAHFILTEDVDLSGNWTPIGSGISPFTGGLDGDGHSINGLSVVSISNGNPAGLFASMTGAKIKNLIVSGGLINTYESAGMLSQYINGGTLENVIIMGGSVKCTGSNCIAGGLAARTSGTVMSDIYSSASVTATFTGSSINAMIAGGIAGQMHGGTATRVTSTGSVTSEKYAGGIAGELGWAAAASISKCSVKGTVTATWSSSDAGGVAGRIIGKDNSNLSKISECYVSGNVSGGRNTGGIAGYAEQADIRDSYAAGNVSGTASTADASGAGGLVGYLNMNSVLENSYFGRNTVYSYYSSGIVGKSANDAVIKNNVTLYTSLSSLLGPRYSVLANGVDTTLSNNYSANTTDNLLNGRDGKGNDISTYTNQDFYTQNLPTWNFSTIWEMGGNGYPALQWVNDAAAAHISYTTNGRSITFTPTVTGGIPLSYFWDFGDGATSTERNPTHIYTADGTYDAELSVTLTGGAVTAAFKVDAFAGTLQPLNVTADSTDITLYLDFVDGAGIKLHNDTTVSLNVSPVVPVRLETPANAKLIYTLNGTALKITAGDTGVPENVTLTFRALGYTPKTVTLNVTVLDGTPASPYPLATQADLELVRYNLSSSFYLTQNISLTGQWTPVGNDVTPYMGTFDGRDKTIGALSVNTAGRYAGLFGYIKNAAVKNLTVTGGTVTSTGNNGFAGGLVGYADGSDMEKIVVTSVTVNCATGNCYAGGVAGYIINLARILKSHTNAGVSATYFAGGLVGGAEDDAVISDSYTNGDVSSGFLAGGIAGYLGNSAQANNCYATGAVDATGAIGADAFSGGLAGAVENNAALKYSAALNSNITGSKYSAPVAANRYQAFLTHNYTDFPGFNEIDGEMGKSETTESFQSQAFYTANLPGWDFTNVWQMPAAADQYRFPYLR